MGRNEDLMRRRIKGTLAKKGTRIEVSKVTKKKSKPVKTPKGNKATQHPRSKAKNQDQFTKEVSDINADNIRKKMNKDIHIIVVHKNQFKELARDHNVELLRVANRTDDEELKEILQDFSSANVDKLAAQLQTEFIKIVDAQFTRSQVLTVEKEKHNDITLYFISRKKQGEKETTYSSIQRAFTEIRKTLVYNSARGTIGRALSVTIAGLDIDYEKDLSGDLGGIAKKKYLLSNAVVNPKSGVIAKGTGFQLGHFRGGATKAGRNLLDIASKYMSNTSLATKIFTTAQRKRDTIHTWDAEVELNDIVYSIAKKKFGAKCEVSIIGIEGAARNQLSGSFTRQELANLKNWLINSGFGLLFGKGSRPIINLVLDDIIDTFLGQRKVTKVPPRKSKVRGKVKAKTGAVSPIIKTRSNVNSIVAPDSSSPENLNAIIDIINRRLHDQIRKNMGKGGAKEVLNYRTGRFAKSAKVEALYDIKEKNALGANVRYMKNPYSVFEPKGRLHKPGRDPHRIFGRSIRQILQEEKLGTLRRVKVNLNG